MKLRPLTTMIRVMTWPVMIIAGSVIAGHILNIDVLMGWGVKPNMAVNTATLITILSIIALEVDRSLRELHWELQRQQDELAKLRNERRQS